MKKIISLLTAVALMLGLCACSKNVGGASWQEQYELGMRYSSEGKYEEAIPAFIAAIEIDPNHVENYEKLAEAYNALNDTKAAVETLRDGFVATGDTKLYAAITEITIPTPASSQELPQELSATAAPAATPISRSDLYPIDYIGMTVDSLAELWGADYQTDEGLYTGGARPIYYEDGRIPLYFFVQVMSDDFSIRGSDEIILVRAPDIIDEVASGIPTKASYLGLWGLCYQGDLWESNGINDEGMDGETATYTIGYSREVSIRYYWYNHKDPRENPADIVEIWKKPKPTQTIHTVDFLIEDDVLVKYTGPGGAVTIPDGVTAIRGKSSIGQYDGAFAYCTNVTSVVIPDSVFYIGEEAFYNCVNLSSIIIPDSMMAIGENAFGACYSLSSIKIPNGLTKIEPYTFSGCSGLKSVTISNSVTDIGIGAFHGCSSLSSITIPRGVTWMNGMSFSECDNLKSFVVDVDNSAFVAQNGVLFNKKLSELVRYPAGKGSSHYSIPDGTTYIGVEAFEGCSNLTEITIPDSVVHIGEHAFAGCIALTDIVIPRNVYLIEDNTFRDCSNLRSITIPKGVQGIRAQAFFNCNSLTDVYYLGTQEEWAAIDLGFYDDNGPLQNATIHFTN